MCVCVRYLYAPLLLCTCVHDVCMCMYTCVLCFYIGIGYYYWCIYATAYRYRRTYIYVHVCWVCVGVCIIICDPKVGTLIVYRWELVTFLFDNFY